MNVDQRAFRDGYEPAVGDVFIAILGVTGAGKVCPPYLFLSLPSPLSSPTDQALVDVHQQMLRKTSRHRPQSPSLHPRSRCLPMPIQRLQHLPRRHARLRRHRSIRHGGAPRNRFMANSVLLQLHQAPWHHLPPPHYRSADARLRDAQSSHVQTTLWGPEPKQCGHGDLSVGANRGSRWYRT